MEEVSEANPIIQVSMSSKKGEEQNWYWYHKDTNTVHVFSKTLSREEIQAQIRASIQKYETEKIHPTQVYEEETPWENMAIDPTIEEEDKKD